MKLNYFNPLELVIFLIMVFLSFFHSFIATINVLERPRNVIYYLSLNKLIIFFLNVIMRMSENLKLQRYL